MAKKDTSKYISNRRRRIGADSSSDDNNDSDCSSDVSTVLDVLPETVETSTSSSIKNKKSIKPAKKNNNKIRKTLADLFTSKQRNQLNHKKNKKGNETDTTETSTDEYSLKNTSTKKRCRKMGKPNKYENSKSSQSASSSSSSLSSNILNTESDSESDSESEYITASSSDSDTNNTMDTDEKTADTKETGIKSSLNKLTPNKINLILNVNEEFTDKMTEEIASELARLEEEDECESADEKIYMADKYEYVDEPESIIKKKNKKRQNKESKKKEEEMHLEYVSDEYQQLLEMKKLLILQHKQFPKNRFIKKSLNGCIENIHTLIKNTRNENTKKYNKLANEELNEEDELTYFKKKLSNKEQVDIMKQLKEINTQIMFSRPHRLDILQSSMPMSYKVMAIKKLNELKNMDGDHEYSKAKLWLDNFRRIPFGIYKTVHISMADGLDKCNDFIMNAKKTLDTCVYGMENAKMQFMQLLGQWIVNPNSVGTAIGLYGPPGTGKTSIIKDGLSKILGREFAFIGLAGNGDASYLEGHSYTYEGSRWGKVVQLLMDAKCMNPIIYFDELDKVSDSAKGQEITGILTHLTDTTQNMLYQDKYFVDVELDLSKCLFVFSYNDENLVNPILRDRMYKIKTSGYETKEKIHIAKNYMLPKIREKIGFTAEDVIIDDDVLEYIIKNMTKGEQGVRNLNRCLETIYTKLNLRRLVKEDSGLFGKPNGFSVSFPYKLVRNEVKHFLDENDPINTTLWAMYT